MPRALVGRLGAPFGVRGELKCVPLPGSEALFVAGRSFEIGDGADARILRCRSARRHHAKIVLAFDGVDTPEAARALAGAQLVVDAADVPLGPGEYLDADLIGLRLLDERGADRGYVVASVAHYPAQDCLVVEPGGALVPLVKAFVREIDLRARTIALELPDGLL